MEVRDDVSLDDIVGCKCYNSTVECIPELGLYICHTCKQTWYVHITYKTELKKESKENGNKGHKWWQKDVRWGC